MSTNTLQPVSQSSGTIEKSLMKRINSTWASLQAVWKLLQVLEEEDHSIW